jgi:hypothetical protein
MTVPCGMMYAARKYDSTDINTHDIMYGLSKRLKLTPAASIEIISEFPAIFEVKKITAMNTNSGEKRFAK